MVARTWRGWTRREDADEYVAYLEQTGMPAYRKDDRFLVARESTVTHWQVD